MAPQNPVPPPPLSTYRPSFERAPLGSGPRRGPAPPGGGRPRQPAPRRRGGGLLLGVVYLFLFVVLVGAGGAGYLLLHPPSDLIRQKIAEQVKARTGRDLIIAGPASVVFYPVLGVSLKDVSLSAPPGMDGKLVQMQALDVSLKAVPLFSRHIEINSIVLRKPVFDLRVDKSGRNNWSLASRETLPRFAELRTPGSERDAEPIAIAAADDAQMPSNSAPAKSGGIAHVQLDDVRIEDGTLRFTDERTGKVEQVSAVNVKLGLDSLESPLVGSGNLAWRDQRIDFDGKLTDVARHLQSDARSPRVQCQESSDYGLIRRWGPDQRRRDARRPSASPVGLGAGAGQLVRDAASSGFRLRSAHHPGNAQDERQRHRFLECGIWPRRRGRARHDQGYDGRRPASRRSEPRRFRTRPQQIPDERGDRRSRNGRRTPRRRPRC